MPLKAISHYFKLRKYQKAQVNHAPPEVAQYLQYFVQRPSLKKTFSTTTFTVFDVEATGLDPKKHQILSIGAVKVQPYGVRLADSFECMVQQEFVGQASVIQIHKILPQDLAGSMPLQEALCKFLAFIQDSVLVAHHLWFDKAMVEAGLKQYFHIGLLNPLLDTLDLARRLEGPHAFEEAGKSGQYTLDALCEQFQIELSFRHTAPGDALATALLLLKLLKRAEKRGIRLTQQIVR
jgi:DNA polymerase-3 subunit epsilon